MIEIKFIILKQKFLQLSKVLSSKYNEKILPIFVFT